jgi:hypothetical protein
MDTPEQIRQALELFDLTDPAEYEDIMIPDHSDEVVAHVQHVVQQRSGHRLVISNVQAARVAQRLLVAFGQAYNREENDRRGLKGADRQNWWYDAYCPEDVFWQIGLMQDYELLPEEEQR